MICTLNSAVNMLSAPISAVTGLINGHGPVYSARSRPSYLSSFFHALTITDDTVGLLSQYHKRSCCCCCCCCCGWRRYLRKVSADTETDILPCCTLHFYLFLCDLFIYVQRDITLQ